jgi:GTPase SAR1 family protein
MFQFQHPFNCIVAGPTQSGKTTLITKILQHQQQLINVPIDYILYCYSEYQNAYDEIRRSVKNIYFHKGLPADYDQFNAQNNNLIIFDDLMEECEKNPSIMKLFTVNSHHKNISTVFITQNIFSQGNTRTMSLNSDYLILFNNPRDQSQVECYSLFLFLKFLYHY